jgi:hypothetical protein
MLTYQNLSARPAAFRSMTGLSVSDFDELYAQLAPAHAERLAQTLTKRHRKPRKRAAGAGKPHRHSLQDRLLLTLMWLRLYPTLEVLGFFFGLNKTNAEDNLKDVLATLDTMTDFIYERPAKDRPKMRSVQAIMDAFPDVCLVIDAKEQRIQRPGGEDDLGNSRQKPFYSGKKKAHTLKNQVAVNPQGRFLSVSESVAGGANHDLTLLRTTKLLGELASGEAAMMDKGYDGITKDYPDATLYLPHKARRNHPLTEEQKTYNRHLSRYRIVVEHSLAQANQFQVLAQVFRHAHGQHSQVMRVVAGLVNRRLEKQPLKSYSNAYTPAVAD